MNISFYISAEEIERKVNALYEEVIFDGVIEDLGARAKVKKKSPIRIALGEDCLLVSAPVHVYAKITWKEKLLGALDFYTPTFEETDFEITAQFTIHLNQNPRWDLNSQTLGSFEWDRKPRVALGPLKMKVTTLLKPLIMGEIVKVAYEIDTFVSEEIALKKRVQEAWDELRNPIEIGNSPPIWLELVLGDQQNKASSLRYKDELISNIVQPDLQLKVSLGPKPLPHPQMPVPAFVKEENLSPEFEHKVINKFGYHALSQAYSGETLHFPDKKLDITIRGLGIKHQNGKINASLSLGVSARLGFLKRNFRLVMFVAALPYIDEEVQKVRVKEVDYAFLSRDPMLRIVNRLFRKRFTRKLSELIHVYIDELDEYVQTQIKAEIKENDIVELIQLKGELSDYQHLQLRLFSDHLELVTRIKGKMAVWITGF